ncbi:MAG: hypothetical protein IPN32_06040 [Deltaproteobacteria bacterium]|nr:hypothetical protein [Deltaproteobacteria bacterium]
MWAHSSHVRVGGSSVPPRCSTASWAAFVHVQVRSQPGLLQRTSVSATDSNAAWCSGHNRRGGG